MCLGEVVSSVLGKNSFRVPITLGKICVGEWRASFSDCRFNLDDLSFMFFSPPGPAGPRILALSLNLIRAFPCQANDNVMRQYQYAEG